MNVDGELEMICLMVARGFWTILLRFRFTVVVVIEGDEVRGRGQGGLVVFIFISHFPANERVYLILANERW